jgi:hypothetical protein
MTADAHGIPFAAWAEAAAPGRTHERLVVPHWLQAGLWGGLAGAALVLGAGVGFFARVPARLVAAVMAFGSGVLISALSF